VALVDEPDMLARGSDIEWPIGVADGNEPGSEADVSMAAADALIGTERGGGGVSTCAAPSLSSVTSDCSDDDKGVAIKGEIAGLASELAPCE